MNSPSLKNPLHAVLFSSIVMYTFFGLLFNAKGLGLLNLIFAVAAITTGIIVFPKFYFSDTKRNELFLIVTLILTIFNYISHGNMQTFALLLSLPLGYLFFNYKTQFKNILIFILAIQFSALLYEWITHNYIYLVTTTGLFNSSYVFDQSAESWKAAAVSGFRAKGLFSGSLLANTFTIDIALIFRKKLSVIFLCLLMSIMTNGRLAFIITFILMISALRSSKSLSSWILSNSRIIKWTILSLTIAIILLLFASITSNKAFNHFLQVVNFDSGGNIARIQLALSGLFIYLDLFSFKQILFGGSRDFGTFIFTTAESEWVNLLLDVGLTGMLLYLIPLIWIFIKSREYNKNPILKLKTKIPSTIALLFFAMVVYRHVTGYLRGGLFWFIIFSCFSELDRLKKSKAKPPLLKQV